VEETMMREAIGNEAGAEILVTVLVREVEETMMRETVGDKAGTEILVIVLV
jgi:hypothetical protein